MQPLAITAYSIVNCLGAGARAVADALFGKRSGLAPCDFDGVALDTWIGRVRGVEARPVRAELGAYDCRNNRMAQLALELDGFAETVARARSRYGTARIGVFMGTSTSGILETELAYQQRAAATGALPAGYRYAQTHNTFSLADFVQRYLGLQGPAFAVSSACSSSAKVFGNAARMIEAGVCDAAVVGGIDTLCLTTLYGFNSLELTSRGPCRPFDAERNGISIGEGGGLALLERAGARAGAEATLLGVGDSCDAYHMSTPHPEGLGARLAMQQALASARLSPADIDYVNLHGTGTRTNDAAEDRAVADLLPAPTPCSSTKGATGHLLGAAGITEIVISMLSIKHQLLPGSANTRQVDPAVRCNYLLEPKAARVRRVLSNSFGFGGSNCAVVLEAAA
ncbi:MAG TPA: beta-ketoacyl-[acyl-carrier-protein] synthase family protein [Burkholderiales bacterium]